MAGGVLTEDVGRDDLVLVQSPAAFRADSLRELYRRYPDPVDETEAMLTLGRRVEVVPGSSTNLHVTTRVELELARWLLGWGDPTTTPGRHAPAPDVVDR
jgi:2-C-methyl-D-erythritol 4-phosphate cytidylyltransferase